MDRVTFATSSGIAWLALAAHLAFGLVSIGAGAIALAVGKGGRLHKQSGMVFTWGMIGLGLTAAGIGMYENVPSQVFAGLLAAYLVFSGMTTVKPLPGIGRRADVGLMLLAFAWAVAVSGPLASQGYGWQSVKRFAVAADFGLTDRISAARARRGRRRAANSTKDRARRRAQIARLCQLQMLVRHRR